MNTLARNSTLEEILKHGLTQFEISNQYIIELVKSNHVFYSMNRAALKDLIISIVKDETKTNEFMDWFDTTCPIFLKEGEPFYGRMNIDGLGIGINEHELTTPSTIELEKKVNELEKRIEGIYDIIDELVKRLE